jgi:hypothetical protein
MNVHDVIASDEKQITSLLALLHSDMDITYEAITGWQQKRGLFTDRKEIA